MTSGLDPDFPGHESNPYAPPRSQFGMRPRGGKPVEVPFDVGCIASASWAIYKERPGPCILVCCIVGVFIWLIQFGQPRLLRALGVTPGDWSKGALLQFGVLFGAYVFNAWLGAGQNLAMLAVSRREPAVLARLIQGGRFVLRSILAAIVFMLAIGTIFVVNMIWASIFARLFRASGAPLAISALSMAISVVAVLYVSVRFSQFPYMIVDQNASALDSLRGSWEATRGRSGTLALVYAMLLVINLAGLLACFVGLIFTIPYSTLVLAVTYLSMTGLPVGGGKSEQGSWDEIAFEGD